MLSRDNQLNKLLTKLLFAVMLEDIRGEVN